MGDERSPVTSRDRERSPGEDDVVQTEHRVGGPRDGPPLLDRRCTIEWLEYAMTWLNEELELGPRFRYLEMR
jgi:hypothetical protein